MLPQLKAYKIDYDFIVSNYLDRSLWKKTWNLFVYKQHVFTLQLISIDTRNEEITFRVKKDDFYDWEDVRYNLQNTSIKILKQQINGAIWRLMISYERNTIHRSSGYRDIEETRQWERNRLREVAEVFLDDNGVTNEDIREPYIDKYVSDNETVSEQLSNFESKSKYNYNTDLFVMFCTVINDEDKLKLVTDNLHNSEKIKSIQEAVLEIANELDTDEWYNDRYSTAEAI